MRYISDARPANVPAASKLVVEGLRKLDHRLYLVYWRLMRDPRDGFPIHLGEDGPPIPHSRWYVFMDGDDGQQLHLFAVEDDLGQFTYPTAENTVARIMGDVARRMSPKQITDMLEERERKEQEGRLKQYGDLREDEFRENKGIIRDMIADPAALVTGAEDNKRDAKIVSYDGQSNRGTHNEAIKRTAEDIGWEKPDYEGEVNGS